VGYGSWPDPRGFRTVAEWLAEPRHLSAIRTLADSKSLLAKGLFPKAQGVSRDLAAGQSPDIWGFADAVTRVEAYLRWDTLERLGRPPDAFPEGPPSPEDYDALTLRSWLAAVVAVNRTEVARLRELLRETPQAGRHHAPDEPPDDEATPRGDSPVPSERPDADDRDAADRSGAPASSGLTAEGARHVAILAVLAVALAATTPLIPEANDLAERYAMWLALLVAITKPR
jgi:hypothetical protein